MLELCLSQGLCLLLELSLLQGFFLLLESLLQDVLLLESLLQDGLRDLARGPRPRQAGRLGCLRLADG